MSRLLFLLFGEDSNDQVAIGNIIRALARDQKEIKVELRRKPIVLSRNAVQSGKRRRMCDDIAALSRAAGRSGLPVVTVVHRDCDQLEPAHVGCAEVLMKELADAGVDRVVIAAPAWEIEAWWMLFPEAVAAVRRCWRRLDYGARHVGRIENAKERLRRDLRPITSVEQAKCLDYAESDGIKISAYLANNTRMVEKIRARSDSFMRFKESIENEIGS